MYRIMWKDDWTGVLYCSIVCSTHARNYVGWWVISKVPCESSECVHCKEENALRSDGETEIITDS